MSADSDARLPGPANQVQLDIHADCLCLYKGTPASGSARYRPMT